jgi:uncharacterized protein YndB with AHSA1/START domain
MVADARALGVRGRLRGLVDGDIVETAADGRRAVWGTVTAWEPPHRLAFTWHAGHGPEAAGRIVVTFAEHAQGTLVRLEHGGWEVYADPEAAREEYRHGWALVLDRYRKAAS